jgi:hypothetical protein
VFTTTREKCSLVGKDDSVKVFSPYYCIPLHLLLVCVIEPKTLVPENYCFQHLCEKNLLNDWKRMWGTAGGGSITAG